MNGTQILKSKPRKASYRKPESVKQLERLADEAARIKHPTMAHEHMAPRTFRDDSANSLTACIVSYVTLKGGFASRINSQGTFSRKLNRYIHSTQKRGIADVMGTYKSKSLMIEVKHGSDKMSTFQERVRAEQTRSGGMF